jgi:hypothetical protein
MDNFAQLLKEGMEYHNLTEQQLANDCEVAISTVQRWLAGTVIPRPQIQKFVLKRLQK